MTRKQRLQAEKSAKEEDQSEDRSTRRRAKGKSKAPSESVKDEPVQEKRPKRGKKNEVAEKQALIKADVGKLAKVSKKDKQAGKGKTKPARKNRRKN